MPHSMTPVFRPSLLFVVLLSGLTALAQVPPPPSPSPLPTVPSRSASGEEMIPQIEFLGADVKEVLRYYEQLTKKKLIYENSAWVGQVNIVVKTPVPKEEAIRIIETTLLMNGIFLVPIEGTDLVNVYGVGKAPQTTGVPIISDELQIPQNEVIISFFLKLHYADPTDVVQAIQPMIQVGAQQFTQIVPLPKAGALLLTDSTPRIRSLLRVIHEIDVPPAEVVSEFIQLRRADAKDVLEKLNDLFGKKDAAPGAPGAAPGGAAAPRAPVARVTAQLPDGTPAPPNVSAEITSPNTLEITSGTTLTEDSLIVGKIKLNADTRTNRIYVVTRPVNMPFIRKLIAEFDLDVRFGEPTVRPLKYISAGDVLQTIVDAITERSENGQGGGAQGGPSGGNRPGQPSNRSQGSDTFGSNRNTGFGSNNGLGGSGGGGSMSLSESLSTQERDVVPESRVVGNTKIIADKRANTIIVLGNQEVKNKIWSLLDHLDVRAPQVMLHTIIGELTLTNHEEFGVNYILHNGSRRGLIGTTTGTGTGSGTGTGNGGTGDGTGTGSASTNAGAISFNNGAPVLNVNSLLSNRNITQILTAGSGGFSGFIAAGNAFDILINALESTDRFKVISRPSVFTTNNKRAVISSGEEIAVPVSVNAGFSGGTGLNGGLVTQSNIQYKTVALQLEILPLINSDREVSLDIVQKVEEEAGSTVIDNNRIPKIAARELKTYVSVPNEGTLVLGGLIKQTHDNSRSGIPVLSRIPLVGALFRSTTKDKNRTELVIMIRPVVTVGPCEDTKASEREREFFNVESDLETAIYPPNMRVRTSPEGLMRKSPLILRQEQECAEEKQVQGFAK